VRGFGLAAHLLRLVVVPFEFRVFVAVPYALLNLNTQISRFDLTGAATTSTSMVKDTVRFAGGGTAIGVATLTKP
jgi:hypothetical protein